MTAPRHYRAGQPTEASLLPTYTVDHPDLQAIVTEMRAVIEEYDERLLIGLSDAGAHLDMLCDAGYSTHLLQRWVRETGALTLEQGVQKLTSIPARFFGIHDRGVLAAGELNPGVGASPLLSTTPSSMACKFAHLPFFSTHMSNLYCNIINSVILLLSE